MTVEPIKTIPRPNGSPAHSAPEPAGSDERARAIHLVAGILAVLLIVAGYVLAIGASGGATCCDAGAYLDEARSIIDGPAVLLPVHNYGYAAFLAVLDVAGLGSRLGIALAQTTLLYAAVLGAAFTISRLTRTSFTAALFWLAAVALLPAAAWSGQVFSEGLAAPVLILVLALTIASTYQAFEAPKRLPTWILVGALGLASGAAWMVRPSLIFLPAAVGLITLVLGVYLAWRGHRSALLLPAWFAVTVMMVALPQFQYPDPLKLEFSAEHRHLAPLTFRWATDLTTETGPYPIVFSPFPDDDDLDATVSRRRALGSTQWKATAMLAHVVSGWDARPSPGYVYDDTGQRWVIVSALSGYLIVGALCAIPILWQRRWRWMRPESYVLIALLFVFAMSQAVLSMVAAEFRFNEIGWLTAGFLLAMVSAFGWWTRRRIAAAVVVGSLVSAAVIALGQFTLMYSEWWLKYSHMVG